MKSKALKAVAGVLACATVVGSMGALAGCGKKTNYDNETTTIAFSTLQVDGVFNPFFATSGTDSTIAGMTQLGMLANDEYGNPTYGDDEAVVVKDMQTIYHAAEDQTEYRFVLKNNVRFSNGSYMTIKDVLFNLYVYLDPVYTGSSTIYSTDIVGLQEYRTQSANEKEQAAFRDQFETAAQTRIDALLMATEDIYDRNDSVSEAQFKAELEQLQRNDPVSYPNVVKDFEQALKLFKEELETDWSNALDSYQDTVFVDDKGNEKKGLLTSDVEQFLYNEGYITWNKRGNGGEGELQSSAGNVSKWTKEDAINFVYNANIPENIDQVIQYWMTAGELYTYLTNEELEAYFQTHEREYKNISGIKFANMEEPVEVNGTTYGVPTYADGNKSQVTEGNEVLSITINKVDPKAIWNFAFAVAPMYYYSDAAHAAAFDYVENFGLDYGSQTFLKTVVNDPDKNGVPVGAGPYAASKRSGGLENVGSGDFYDLNNIYFEANPYFLIEGTPIVKHLTFQVTSESNMLNALYSGDLDFVEPNAKTDNFNEVRGKEKQGIGYDEVQTAGYGYIGINAGKVPNLKVRQAIMHCIDITEAVTYYGTHAEALYRSMTKASWVYDMALRDKTSYYPYIGGKVPTNLNVVNPDYREFVESHGYKAGDTLSKEDQEAFIRGIIEDEGYSENAEGVYRKGTDTLNYTFTVVGSEKDHPAWQALWHAKELLDEWGFKITVKTDINGLQKLTNGSLTVWAAAWGSTIDPDMYQVYHKDSTATSVLNWGYRQILQNAGGRYQREYDLVDDLSLLIEQAREIDDSTEANKRQRAQIYAEALDLVMQLAVELPTYQRNDLFVYNSDKIDASTFFQNATAFKGLTSDLHLISLNVER